MGDYQLPSPEDPDPEVPEYTADWFTCGLCGVQTSSIESYVSHMVLQERCVLHLCPSTAIRDLLLPRFSKRRRSDGEGEEEEEDVKQVKGGGGGGGGGGMEDTKVELQAEEVETGEERRWKCQLCGLTFSRQAAILNHFKLQHSTEGCGTVPSLPQLKEEAVTPVRHIVVVEAKPSLNLLAPSEGHPDKAWNKLACHLCGQIFKTGKILRTHISVVHSQGRPFQCAFQGCSQTFKTKGSLKRHERRHTGERPFACQACGRCFRESGSLTRHLQAQVPCVNKSDTQIPLYGRTLPLHPQHMDRKPSVPSDLKANILPKQELCTSEEQHHHLKESQSPLSPLQSQSLGHPEESKATLRSQLASPSCMSGSQLVKQEENSYNSHSNLSHPPVSCKVELPPPPSSSPPPHLLLRSTPYEGRDSSEGLEDDVKPPSLAADILRNSFTCPVCWRSYLKRSALALHLKLHLDKLGGKCSECQKSFATRQALGRHLSSHSSLRQYECQACGKTFKLLSHAKAHLTAHSSSKSVPCRHCPNLYKTKSARNLHERSHTSLPAFLCLQCQRRLPTKASLMRHLRSHTGETPFHCQYCGRGFKEHGTLSRHLRNKITYPLSAVRPTSENRQGERRCWNTAPTLQHPADQV